jgi:hypothetical protein
MKSIRDTCVGLLKNQEVLSLINECKSHVVKLVYDEIYIYIWLICIYSILLLIIVLAILILMLKQLRITKSMNNDLIGHI